VKTAEVIAILVSSSATEGYSCKNSILLLVPSFCVQRSSHVLAAAAAAAAAVVAAAAVIIVVVVVVVVRVAF
jgi:hypothetical protein